jgi:hypothetical protein
MEQNEDAADRDLLSDALKSEPPAAPAPAEGTQPEAQPGSTAQPRDEAGRFAPKTEAAPEPPKSQAQEQPQVAQPSQAPSPADNVQPQDHRVPLRELLDEREKRQQAAADAATLRQQVEYMSHLLGQMQQPQPPRPGQPQQAEPVDIFSNPDAYLDQRINPYVKQFSDALMQIKEGNSRIMAIEKYGQEAVDTAYAEIAKLRMSGQGLHDYERIMASPHPYGELVQWHKERNNLKMVGSDPNAWLEQQIAERLKDPTFRAKAIELERAQQQQPSNGSGRPAAQNIQLPPSLSKTPAAMGVMEDEATDQSDAALLKWALPEKQRR